MICISILLIVIGSFMLGSLFTYQQFRYKWYHDGYVKGNKDGWEECEECWLLLTIEKEQSK